jgi:hypothetical protein
VDVCRWVEGADKQIGTTMMPALALSLTANRLNRIFKKT